MDVKRLLGGTRPVPDWGMNMGMSRPPRPRVIDAADLGAMVTRHYNEGFDTGYQKGQQEGMDTARGIERGTGHTHLAALADHAMRRIDDARDALPPTEGDANAEALESAITHLSELSGMLIEVKRLADAGELLP